MKAGAPTYRWTGAALLLLVLLGICWYWSRSNPPAPSASGEAAASRAKPTGFPVPAAREEDADARSRERTTVQIPIAMIAAIHCNVFDEDNGGLDPQFARFLRLAPEERQGVRRIITEHLQGFGEIEVANYEIERSTGAPVIRLKPCEQQATELMAKTQRSLAEVLGASRPEAASMWLAAQLRHGGRDWADVSFNHHADRGGWILDRAYGSRPGMPSSHFLGAALPTPGFAQFFRWRHLDRIDLSAGE